MTTAAADAWWADWPKFLPGWLAFVWTVGAGARKVWVRRHRVALGPADDELREALTAIRSSFEDITAHGGRRADWFTAEERRETARKIEDLAARRKDSVLREGLAGVTRGWNEAFAEAPPMRLLDGVLDPTPSQESREHLKDVHRFGKQTAIAATGLYHVNAALARLNELERRTHGRS